MSNNPVEEIFQLAKLTIEIIKRIPRVVLALVIGGYVLSMPEPGASTEETMRWSTSLVNSTVRQSVDASMPMTASFFLNPGKMTFMGSLIFGILVYWKFFYSSGGRY